MLLRLDAHGRDQARGVRRDDDGGSDGQQGQRRRRQTATTRATTDQFDISDWVGFIDKSKDDAIVEFEGR